MALIPGKAKGLPGGKGLTELGERLRKVNEALPKTRQTGFRLYHL
jgi:hypothetical protein